MFDHLLRFLVRKKLFKKSGSSKHKVPLWAANRELHRPSLRESLIASSCRNMNFPPSSAWLTGCFPPSRDVLIKIHGGYIFHPRILRQRWIAPPVSAPPGESCLLVLGGCQSVGLLPSLVFIPLTVTATLSGLKIPYCLLKPSQDTMTMVAVTSDLQTETPQWTLNKRDRWRQLV